MLKKNYVVIILVIVVLGFIVFGEKWYRKNYFANSIIVNQDEVLDKVSDSETINLVGNYIFLMSPTPNDDKDQEWYKLPSYLVITSNYLQIRDVIKLDGYYGELALKGTDLFVFNRNSADNDYVSKLDNPRVQVSTSKKEHYSNFKEYDDDFDYPTNRAVAKNGKKLTIINDNQVIAIKDPTFNSQGHDYKVVDFAQNVNGSLLNKE